MTAPPPPPSPPRLRLRLKVVGWVVEGLSASDVGKSSSDDDAALENRFPSNKPSNALTDSSGVDGSGTETGPPAAAAPVPVSPGFGSGDEPRT